MMKMMAMNDSNNQALLASDQSRVSLVDAGSLRKKDFLGGCLERLTNEVKVAKEHVPQYQAGFEPQYGSSTSHVFGVSQSFATGVQVQ